jgi:uracil-DNA glycosylase family 4
MDSFQQIQLSMKDCQKCLDEGFDIVPGAIFSGPQSARAMIIGQAPGVTEVEAKRPFNAGSGKRLFDWLNRAGWEELDFRQNQYMTSVTKCYPGKDRSGKGDRVPSKQEQLICRPYLQKEFRIVDAVLIMPVGKLAIAQFFREFKRLSDLIGQAAYISWEHRSHELPIVVKKSELTDAFTRKESLGGSWVVPLPHPSGASLWPNKPENKMLIDRAINIIGDIRSAYDL